MKLKPARTPWGDFPPVVIHSPEIAVKRHPDYRAAKSGDVQAAFSLVRTTIAESAVVKIRDLVEFRNSGDNSGDRTIPGTGY